MDTDLELVNATLSGEKEAFGQLVLRYQKKVYRLVYRIIDNSFDASDIVQNTFVTAYQNLEQLKDRDKFSSWLFRIAKNACISWIRKYQKNLINVEDEIENGCLHLPLAPDEILIERELHEQVMKAISKLPEYNRKAVEMFYLEGKSYSEIQNELGITKGTLGRWLHQARLELRKSLKAAYQGAFWISSGLKRIFKSNHCSGQTLSRPVGTVTNATVVSTAKCIMISMIIHILVFTGMSITETDWGFINGTDGQTGYSSAIKISLVENKAPDSILISSRIPGWVNSLSQFQNTETMTAKNKVFESLPPKRLRIETVQIITVPKESTQNFSSEPSVDLLHVKKYLDYVNTGLVSTPVTTAISLVVPFTSRSIRSQNTPMLNNLSSNQDELMALDGAVQPLVELPHVLYTKEHITPDYTTPYGTIEKIATLEKGLRGGARSVTFSPDGKLLASAHVVGNKIMLWDIEKRKVIAVLTGHSDNVTSVAFNPDGKLLASASWDKKVLIWDVERRKEVAELTGHSKHVLSVAFSSDGKLLASGSEDEKVLIWDVERRKEIAELTGHYSLNDRYFHWINSVAFSPDGKLLAFAVDDSIILWDVEKREEITTLMGHTSRVNSVAFSPDGKLLASGSRDKKVLLWDVKKRREIATFLDKSLKKESDEVMSVAFSPNGKLLASGSDKKVLLWDVKKRREIATLLKEPLVSSVAFSPDGKLLASVSLGRKINLWRFSWKGSKE